MKKIIPLLLSFTLLTGWILKDHNPHKIKKHASLINSGGAPTGKTGAPGESTCTMCHSGNVNDGSTFSSISFSGINSEYVPGTTYDLTLTLNNGSTKNGFQLVVLDSITNSNSGTLILTDAVNTKITSGNNRNYLNHTSAGNSQTSWNFQWTAPSSYVGPIKIYYAYNIAGYPYSNTSGDDIYTSVKTLSVPNTSFLSTNELLDFNCFLDNNKRLNIISNFNSKKYSKMKIYNITGKLMYSKNLNLRANQVSKVNIPSNLTSGIYLISLDLGTDKKTKKIVL